jgi:hypothetical protein
MKKAVYKADRKTKEKKYTKLIEKRKESKVYKADRKTKRKQSIQS